MQYPRDKRQIYATNDRFLRKINRKYPLIRVIIRFLGATTLPKTLFAKINLTADGFGFLFANGFSSQ